MRVIVCMRHRLLLHAARIQAERHGVKVDIARDGQDVLRQARDTPPDLIVLGKDLSNPSTDELVRTIKLDPALRAVQVIVADGPADFLKARKPFPWPAR